MGMVRTVRLMFEMIPFDYVPTVPIPYLVQVHFQNGLQQRSRLQYRSMLPGTVRYGTLHYLTLLRYATLRYATVGYVLSHLYCIHTCVH